MNKSKTMNKFIYKKTYDNLKKMTVVTLIVCFLFILLTPLIIFMKSKYKVVERKDEFSESNQTENKEINTDIF